MNKQNEKDPGERQQMACIYLFIYFWLCWVSVAAPGLSLGAVREGGALSIEVCGLWAHGLSD